MPVFLRSAFVLMLCTSLVFAGKFLVTMPGAYPQKADDYICTTVPLSDFRYEPGYVTAFKPIVNSSVHHIILSACGEWLSGTEAERPGSCVDQCRSHILYAWAHHGSPLVLPKGTAFEIGRDTPIRSLSLEVHYSRPEVNPDYASIELTYTRQPQPNRAGVILLYNAEATIPPHVQHFPTNISCKLITDAPINIFGIRTHAHDLNKGVYGYYFSPRDEQYHLMIKGNAQWPQTFYKPSQLSADSDIIRLHNGDILMGRCVYDSTDRNTSTSMGSTHADEMCNLYLMYSVDSRYKLPVASEMCEDDMVPGVWEEAPVESLEYVTDTPPEAPIPEMPQYIEFLPDTDWSIKGVHQGKVAGIALVDEAKDLTRLFVLRRGDNPWNADSFTAQFVYNEPDATFVPSPILRVDAESGKVLQSFGNGLFILPHGLSIAKDKSGKPTALWATDIARHQVMKFDWNKLSQPSLVLGKHNRPGNDEETFCMPADVAVASTGEIFVADGYCNQRVVKFSPTGEYMTEWGAGGVDVKEGSEDGFLVVHSITIIPASTENTSEVEQVCVADREHARISCYDLSGRLLTQYGGSVLQPSVYAISFSPAYNLVFGVTGPLNYTPSRMSHLHLLNGFEGAEEVGNTVFAFRPRLARKGNRSAFVMVDDNEHLLDLNLQSPHDLEVSQDGSVLFVAQLKSPYLSKIQISTSVETKKSVQLRVTKDATQMGEGGQGFITRASESRTLFQKIFITAILITLCAVVAIMALILFRSRNSQLWSLTKPGQRRAGTMRNKRRRYDGFQPLPQDETQGLRSSAVDSDDAVEEDSNTIIDIRKLGPASQRKQLFLPQTAKNSILFSNHHVDT